VEEDGLGRRREERRLGLGQLGRTSPSPPPSEATPAPAPRRSAAHAAHVGPHKTPPRRQPPATAAGVRARVHGWRAGRGRWGRGRESRVS
jgi:hypothetical protein